MAVVRFTKDTFAGHTWDRDAYNNWKEKLIFAQAGLKQCMHSGDWYEWQCSEFKQVLHHGYMFTSWNQFHTDFLSSLSELCVTCSNAGAHRLYCSGCLFSWVFLQLLSINIYVSMASNLTADLGLGGNSHTAVGLARKKQQLQLICPPCFGSPLFPGTCCVQSSQLYSEIMSDSWMPFGEAITEKKNLKNYKSANAGSPLSQQNTWE